MTDALVSPAGMRIIRILVGKEPRTVAELISETGVTRTAVTEQLNELMEAGFVHRTTERLPGRGRPRHLYVATGAALLALFASNQHLVVPAIWRAIGRIGGAQLTQQVLKQVSRILADHYRRRITAKRPEQRLSQMIDLLRDEGGVVDVEAEDGKLIIHKRSCAFISMFDEDRTVCRVDEEMMSAIVGRRVRCIESRHDGAPCCSFRFEVRNGKPRSEVRGRKSKRPREDL